MSWIYDGIGFMVNNNREESPFNLEEPYQQLH